jgi:hypothetical protein
MVVEHPRAVKTGVLTSGVGVTHELEVRAGRPEPSAIRSASSTRSVRMLAASCHPTIILENTSTQRQVDDPPSSADA